MGANLQMFEEQMSTGMDHFDALMKYWQDPSYIIIPDGETDEIIAWLQNQTPDTWHNVVLSWNYDNGDKVLTWILNQEDCDRGTAAQVFLVEGVGHWLFDGWANAEAPLDDSHVCVVALKNWSRYKTGEFKHRQSVTEAEIEKAIGQTHRAALDRQTVEDILRFQGTRDAVSEFGSQDGKIVVDFNHWLAENGISIKS